MNASGRVALPLLVILTAATFTVLSLVPAPRGHSPYASIMNIAATTEAEAYDCPNTFCLNAADPCTGAEIGLACHISGSTCTTRTCE